MSFKFIPNTNTLLTAGDADTLGSIDLGGIFKSSTVRSSFQIGNTSASGQSDYTIVVSGVESAIRDNVSYSKDGNTWASSLVVSGVKANSITDLLHVRLVPSNSMFTASGSFLINVVES